VLFNFVASVPLLIWIYLLLGRGGFWRARKQFAARTSSPTPDRKIVAVIPARDEAEVIGETVRTLLQQNLASPLRIIVVDDNSSDGTSDAAKTAAETVGASHLLTVMEGQPLTPGWTGKLWAVSQGVALAETFQPDYFLLTDADIRHTPNSVRNLVAVAEEQSCDLASYMVKLATDTAAEKMLIPAFVYFFLQLYPPKWIASQRMRTAGAAGGCMLIRREALARIGGIAAIRHEVIDDCALAKAVKRSGGRLWMGLTDTAESLRSYGGFAGVGRMISRSAFSQLRHSALLLVLTIIGLFVTYLLGPLLLFTGQTIPMLLGGTAWLLMSLSYLPTMRFYRRPTLWCVCLPVIAVFYAGATIHSAWQYWRGVGGAWKGRVQDARIH
jgi:hopene-associated glycosyltransferase HpnB